MDKTKLEQYGALRREIEMYDNQIAEAEVAVKCACVSDTVKGSMPEHPFVYHTISLHGLPEYSEEARTIGKEVFAIKVRRRQAQAKALRALNEIEEYISGIDDSLTRQIFMLRCVEGLTWAQIARRVGGKNNADSVRMAYNRYFKKK